MENLFLIPESKTAELNFCKKCPEFVDDIFKYGNGKYYVCNNEDCDNSLRVTELTPKTICGLEFMLYRRVVGRRTSKYKHVVWNSKLKKWVIRCYIRSAKCYKFFGSYDNEEDAGIAVTHTLHKQYPEVINYTYQKLKVFI